MSLVHALVLAIIVYITLMHFMMHQGLNPTFALLIAFSINVFVIFMYGTYRCHHPNTKDSLEVQFLHSAEWFDGWSFSHLFVFFLIGTFPFESPWYLLIPFAFGVLWEVIEWFAGNPDFSFGNSIWENESRIGWMVGGKCQMSTDKDDGKWWYGKWTDILMNGTGLLLGYGLKTAIG